MIIFPMLPTTTSHPLKGNEGPTNVNVASLPAASSYKSKMVYLIDQNRLAYSNGINWLYTDTNGVVS